MISISTSQIFRSWVVIFHLRRPMAFLSFNLYDTPGLAPRMNVSFWGPCGFPVVYSNMDTSWNAWKSSFRKFYGRYGDLIQQYWSLPLTNVKRHSDPWPTVTSQPIRLSSNFVTLIPSLAFTELWVVSKQHLQRVWHASRERLPI